MNRQTETARKRKTERDEGRLDRQTETAVERQT